MPAPERWSQLRVLSRRTGSASVIRSSTGTAGSEVLRWIGASAREQRFLEAARNPMVLAVQRWVWAYWMIPVRNRSALSCSEDASWS